MVISAVLLLIVLGGFTPTLDLRPVFKPPALPAYLFLHGIVLTSWFAWLFMQSLLIRSGKTALHRRLGVLGAVLAAAVPFAGLMATAGVTNRVAAAGIDLDADASVLVGLGLSGLTVREFLAFVAWANLSSAISFAVLAWTGILLRRRPAAHKRLMLLATVAILGPALARLSRLPIFGAIPPLFLEACSLSPSTSHRRRLRRPMAEPPFCDGCSDSRVYVRRSPSRPRSANCLALRRI